MLKGRQKTDAGLTVGDLTQSWQLSLEAENKSKKTLETYLEAIRLFERFLRGKGMPEGIGSINREHVEAFIADMLTLWKPATASVRYRSLQQFFKWAVEDGEIKDSPMKNMKPPIVPVDPPPLLSIEQLRALIRACEGQDYADRRDMALLRLFVDTGARRSEIAGLSVGDVDWKIKAVVVTGKGRSRRACPFGSKAARALDRYIRARRSHRDADRPELWLGLAGPMTSGGIFQTLRKRAAKAGVDSVHPHLFRHGFAHAWLAAGGQESDLMQLTGWRSRSMLSRYAASAAAERARDAHKRLSLGDQI